MSFWSATDGRAREIRYIHMNPVRRELVRRPTEWAWSSARWYAEWAAGRDPGAGCPLEITLGSQRVGGFVRRNLHDAEAGEKIAWKRP